MPISLEQEEKVLYSYIVSRVEDENSAEFLSLFPEMVAKAKPVYKKHYKREVIVTGLLPGEIDLELSDYATKFFELGTMYYSGNGRNKDFKKAVLFFEEANNIGIPHIKWSALQYQLAQIYAKGLQDKESKTTVPVRPVWAVMYLLSIIEGMDEDEKEKNKHYAMAAIELAKILMSSTISLFMTEEDKKYVGKKDDLNTFEDFSAYSQEDLNKSAIKFLKKAAKLKNAEACFLLGQIYEAGKLVDKDAKQATGYYLKANSSGHNKGMENAKRLIEEHKKEESKKEADKETRSKLSKRPREKKQEVKDDDNLVTKSKRRKTESSYKQVVSENKEIDPGEDEIKSLTASSLQVSTNPIPQNNSISASVPSLLEEKPNRVRRIPKKGKSLPKSSVVVQSDVQSIPELTSSSLRVTGNVTSPSVSAENKKEEKREESKVEEKKEELIESKSLLDTGFSQPIPKGFNPKIKFDQISSLTYSSGRFFNANHKKIEKPPLDVDLVSRSGKKKRVLPKTALTQDAKNDIGRWGEKYVFEQLQQHYLAKYSKTKVTQTSDGFTLNGEDKNGKAVQVVVTWYNKEEESGAPLDLKLIKKRNSQLVKTRYIEVKTTQGGEKNAAVAHFSAKEIEMMLQYRKQYALYRVYNAKESEPRIEKTTDPWEKINDNKLNIESIGLRI